MIKFYIIGQTIRFSTPAIAADSLNYLEAEFNFAEAEEWAGASKWAHFRQEREGEAATVYDINLDENDRITADKKLNLTQGEWEVYLTGTVGESRLTTIPVVLTVYKSGLIDGPLHEIPQTVAEQIDIKASTALINSRTVLEMAENGEFDGKDGKSLAPVGHFNTEDELEALGDRSNVYTVGLEKPYDLYSWDGINLIWRNQGPLQGADGEDGENGATFTPYVDVNGNLSWTNDKGLDNPPVRNIMGEKGDTGDVGPAGPGAYEKAAEAGYTGTEATFYVALTYMPYHHARHEPGGADPLLLGTDSYGDGSITAEKLADSAKSKGVAVVLTVAGWSGNSQTVNVEGVTAGNNVLVAAAPASRSVWNDAEVYCSGQGGGTLTFACSSVPSADVTANVVILV